MSGQSWPGRRLSALDGSFLRLESSGAHMHVGWSAVFAAPDGHERPTVEALRERVASRLDDVGWCRWKLQDSQLGLSEPHWVWDRDFDPAVHVLALREPDERLSYTAFAALRDQVLSAPLDRSRALWEIFLAPCLEDGRVGMVGKIHHALVDGIAALQMVGLIVDEPPTATGNGRVSAPPDLAPTTARGGPLDRLSRYAGGGLSVLKAAATVATRPAVIAGTAVRDARNVVEAARDELLPAAPDSILNGPTGGRRTLVGYHASLADLRAARAGGGTLNDIGLTVVAGALRALEIQRGAAPVEPFKAMVPVSMRKASETGPGNRISMIYIQLPVHLATPQERLEWVRAETRRLKDGRRAQNMQTLYAAGGLLPAPLRSPVAKAMASARVFNLTISQSPGPRGPVHVLGWTAEEVYSVVPFAAGHALAIGMLRYRQELFIGCYADPDALPEVRQLPALLETQLRALGRRTTSDHPKNVVQGVRPALRAV